MTSNAGYEATRHDETQLALPRSFRGIGYRTARAGLPLEAFDVPVPVPTDAQILIRVVSSSLNPLDYKLAELNFFGLAPPVVLGFDLSGVVVATGNGVRDLAVGDEVLAMADSSGNGGWGEGGAGWAVARECLTVKKPAGLSFHDAGVVPLCFLSAYLGIVDCVAKSDTVYIPGGAGGVGHLAVQIAAHALGARVVSSGSSEQSRRIARECGASVVVDYKRDDAAAVIAELTGGRGADVVYDTTYSETSFVATAKLVRAGGTWGVLGVGPGRTTRTAVTGSPVDGILADKQARRLDVNLLKYFAPGGLDDLAAAKLKAALEQGVRWIESGRVKPLVGKTIEGTAAAISAELAEMKGGRGRSGKVAVVLDPSADGARGVDGR